MKTAIVMTAYNREEQLGKTLESFERYYDKDFLVFIDKDPDPKDYFNPCVAYNRAFSEALRHDPDIIIIQNGECYHNGDIIGYAEKHLTESNYLSFGCYSLSEKSPLPPVILWDEGASFDGQCAWYNHSKFRPVGYHFCSAITPSNLRKLNGFDERFAHGIGYDDSHFVRQIKELGLKIEIIDEPFVFHQWHYSNKLNNSELINRNKTIYENIRGYRAEHLITPDL